MIKILILITFLGILLCAVVKDERQVSWECEYNILNTCEGKCCKKCEVKKLCKIACEESPEQCGGRINY